MGILFFQFSFFKAILGFIQTMILPIFGKKSRISTGFWGLIRRQFQKLGLDLALKGIVYVGFFLRPIGVDFYAVESVFLDIIKKMDWMVRFDFHTRVSFSFSGSSQRVI